jgi:hypothetical protein
LSPRKNEALFTWIEIARSISTLFSALFLVLTHLFDLIGYNVRGALADQRDADQKTRVHDEIENLAQSLRLRIAAANFPDQDRLTDLLAETIKTFELPEHPHPYPATNIWKAYTDLAWRLFQDEGFATIEPPSYRSEIEKARYADYLLKLDGTLKNPKETLDTFLDAVARSFVLFAQRLPHSAFTMDDDGSEIPTTFHVSLLETLTDLPDVIQRVVAPFGTTRTTSLGMFSTLGAQLTANSEGRRPPLPHIEDYRGTSRDMVDAYLKDTPLHPLFDVMIPFSIKPADRLEHWHLLAPTGWGKTQTLQHIIYHDITGLIRPRSSLSSRKATWSPRSRSSSSSPKSPTALSSSIRHSVRPSTCLRSRANGAGATRRPSRSRSKRASSSNTATSSARSTPT